MSNHSLGYSLTACRWADELFPQGFDLPPRPLPFFTFLMRLGEKKTGEECHRWSSAETKVRRFSERPGYMPVQRPGKISWHLILKIRRLKKQRRWQLFSPRIWKKSSRKIPNDKRQTKLITSVRNGWEKWIWILPLMAKKDESIQEPWSDYLFSSRRMKPGGLTLGRPLTQVNPAFWYKL